MSSVVISIIDCNHGFFEPEEEECRRLSAKYNIDIRVQFINCTSDKIVDKCQDSQIIIVQRTSITGEVINRIPACKIVVRLGVGLDNINLEEMKEHGVEVIHFPDFCTEEVANHTVGMILSAYRRLPIIEENRYRLGGMWGTSALMLGVRKASATTIGILGFGRIGKAVAERMIICGFKVIACDPYIHTYNVPLCDYRSLFSRSDIVSINCSLTDRTRDLVNYDTMRLMKKGSCIINTARGAIVKIGDLISLLKSHHIRLAYVDVLDMEPPVPSDLQHSNLYITPHIAFYSWDSLDYLKRQVIVQSVERWCELCQP